VSRSKNSTDVHGAEFGIRIQVVERHVVGRDGRHARDSLLRAARSPARRLAFSRRAHRMRRGAERARERVERGRRRDEPDDLDVLRIGQPLGEHTLEPSLGQPARVGAHAMDRLDGRSGQRTERVVRPVDGVRRERGPASRAQRATECVTRLGDDREPLARGPPGARRCEPFHSSLDRASEIASDRIHGQALRNVGMMRSALPWSIARRSTTLSSRAPRPLTTSSPPRYG
jgi:hypothetical protein